MAYQASWGKRTFKISAKQINAITGLSISDSYNDDFDSNGKRIGREPTTFTVETTITTAVAGKGKSALSEMNAWRNSAGKSAYFYLGGKKLFSKQYRLLKVDSSGILLDNNGRMLQVKLSLSFEQKATAAQDAAARAAAKSKAISKSSSSSSSATKNADTYDGGRMSYPVPGKKTISSNYGPRKCPYHGRETHSGIDIAANTGTKIIAAAPGKVVLAGSYGGYGKCIIIDHGKKIWTLYGHCSSLLVKKGAKVKEKQVIAKVGSTGNSTGSHLHFEVRKGANKSSKHVSPWKYIKK